MRTRFTQRYCVSHEHEGLSGVESRGNSCWAIGPGHLLRSDTGGKTWINSYFSSPLAVGTNPHRVAFQSPDQGILMAKQGPMSVVFFLTDDGGRHWLELRRLRDGGYVWAELFALSRTQNVWSLIKRRSGEAFVEAIDTSARTWERAALSIPGEPREIVFADKLNGWILERWNKDSWIKGSPKVQRTTSVVHHTRDGGASWEVVFKQEWSCLKLTLTDSGSMVMVGEDGIFMSEDRGINWRRVFNRPRVALFDVHFRGPAGIAVGTEGLIKSKTDILLMVTQDDGRTWTEVDAPAIEAFVGARMMTWSSGILASDSAIYTFEIGS